MTGPEFRAWRRERRFTQPELATLLEVHPITVSNWERSVYPVPRWVPRLLKVIARAQDRGDGQRQHPANRRGPYSGAAQRKALHTGAAHA